VSLERGAFSLNNWKESWSTKMQEIELLTSIHKEFTLNRNELNRSIEKAQNIQEKCEALLAHTGNHEMKLSRLESDSLINTGLTNIITFDVSNGILADIINSGKIHIIQNEKLRNNLSNWNGLLGDVKEDETWAVDASHFS